MATRIVAPGGAPTHPQGAGNALSATTPQPESLQGTHIVPASLGCFYPPAIDSEDLLQVDFDRRQIGRDGLYLVELVQDGRVAWRGARRFHHHLDGLYIDQTGDGEHKRIASPAAVGLRVAGYVLEVYKPARRIAELAQALQRAA